MSSYNESGHKGFPAGATLEKGTIVKLSAGSVIACTAATDKAIGYLTEDVESGMTADVRLISSRGTVVLRAGAAVAVGAYLVSDGDGEAITATQATAGAQPTARVVGQALEAASAADVLFEALILNMVY